MADTPTAPAASTAPGPPPGGPLMRPPITVPLKHRAQPSPFRRGSLTLEHAPVPSRELRPKEQELPPAEPPSTKEAGASGSVHQGRILSGDNPERRSACSGSPNRMEPHGLQLTPQYCTLITAPPPPPLPRDTNGASWGHLPGSSLLPRPCHNPYLGVT